MPDDQYMGFIDSVVGKIAQAPENGTVEIDAGVWQSYRTEVFQALAKRPDVTLKTTYKGAGGLMSFTIPAGADVLGAVGRRTVVTFAELAALLGVTPVEAGMKLEPRA
ncbi:MAG: hypothetical protein K6F56_09630 [Oscillospiraceae bacterium]|nr:hypothetical protein [Oscillospiraceae bacterium]